MMDKVELPSTRLVGFVLATIAAVTLCVSACQPEPEKIEEGGTEQAEGHAAEGGQTHEHAEGEAHEDHGADHGDEHAASTETAEAAAKPAEAADAEACKGDKLAPGTVCHYGGEFALADAPIALTAALAKVDALLEKPVKIEGTVGMSCRKKGCWMTLEPGAEAESVRVTFKDYKFFVPKFADGSQAVLEGTFVQETLTEGTRRHLARDAGKPEAEVEAITGDEHIVQFVATAVELTGGETEPSP